MTFNQIIGWLKARQKPYTRDAIKELFRRHRVKKTTDHQYDRSVLTLIARSSVELLDIMENQKQASRVKPQPPTNPNGYIPRRKWESNVSNQALKDQEDRDYLNCAIDRSLKKVLREFTEK